MSENKRRSRTARSPRVKDKNGSLEELSKVNYTSSTVIKNETEVKCEGEEEWNQNCVDVDIVKKEEITEQDDAYSEERRPKRLQLRHEATPELSENVRITTFECQKLQKRAKKKSQASESETPDEKAERKRREAEKTKLQRAQEDPEKRKERLRKANEWDRRWRAKHTPEEAAARRKRYRERKRQELLNDPERKAQELMKDAARKRKKAKETPEHEKREQRLRNNERDRFNRLEKKLTMTEEEKMEERNQRFFKKQAFEAKMTQEELEAYKERKKELNKEYFKNLSGEKLERHKANMYKAVKKFTERNKERRKRKLEEDPIYRAKERLKYRIIQAKQKLKRDLTRDGVSEEVIKEELTKLAERMRAEPLPPPETVSEYKPRPRKKHIEDSTSFEENPKASIHSNKEQTSPSSFKCSKPPLPNLAPPQRDSNQAGENPVQDEFHENSFDEVDDFHEMEVQELPLSVPSPPSPELSSSIENIDDPKGIVASSNQGIQSPILLLTPPPAQAFPSPTVEPARKTISSGVSSSPCSVSTTEISEQLTSHCDNPSVQSNLWKCPICRTVLPSKENFSKHYNGIHKKLEARPKQPDKPKSLTPPFLCMKCPLEQQLTSGNNSFMGKGNLFAHVRQKHRKFYFPCPKCNILKYRKSALEQHLSICQS